MGFIKRFGTTVNGKELLLNFPEGKKNIILRGSNALHIIYLLESLITHDFTGYNYKLDTSNGIKYNEIEGRSFITFENGAIEGIDNTINSAGSLPLIHCIRYVGGTEIRSVVNADNTLSNTDEISNLSVNLTQFNDSISELSWIRIIATTNKLLGYEFVKLDGQKLIFDFESECEWSSEARKLVYILVGECYLTPRGYKRLFLLPNIEFMTSKQQLILIQELGNSRDCAMCISSANIDIQDIGEKDNISFLNV